MKSLSSILKQKKGKSPILRGALIALTIEEANKILCELFGEEIKSYARAIYIKNKVLAISCAGSAAAQEIKINELKILAKIKEKFGPETIKKIKYVA